MQRKKILSALLLIMAAFMVSFTHPYADNDGPKNQKVNWLSFEEAVSRFQQEPRMIMVDVYTDWCGWCKKMDAATFSNPEIAKYINQHYYPVKLDGEGKQPIVFAGNTFKFVANGRSGYHELAAYLMNGQMSYPTVVFLDMKGQKIHPMPGYRTPEQMDPALKFFVETVYQNKTPEQFEKEYVNPFARKN